MHRHTHTLSLSGSTRARCEETQSNVARNRAKNHEERRPKCNNKKCPRTSDGEAVAATWNERETTVARGGGGDSVGVGGRSGGCQRCAPARGGGVCRQSASILGRPRTAHGQLPHLPDHRRGVVRLLRARVPTRQDHVTLYSATS